MFGFQVLFEMKCLRISYLFVLNRHICFTITGALAKICHRYKRAGYLLKILMLSKIYRYKEV